ncbi:unknown [Firmicutes bacterium CAG:240]|nr:unknown [Firmicutes bacterium CAG:240]
MLAQPHLSRSRFPSPGRPQRTRQTRRSTPAAKRPLRWSKLSSIPLTRWTAILCPFPLSSITQTAPSSLALPLTKSAAFPLSFPSGLQRPVHSATSVHSYVRMLPSVPSLLTRKRPRQLPKMQTSLTSAPARAKACTSTPWPFLRSTAWAAVSA